MNVESVLDRILIKDSGAPLSILQFGRQSLADARSEYAYRDESVSAERSEREGDEGSFPVAASCALGSESRSCSESPLCSERGVEAAPRPHFSGTRSRIFRVLRHPERASQNHDANQLRKPNSGLLQGDGKRGNRSFVPGRGGDAERSAPQRHTRCAGMSVLRRHGSESDFVRPKYCEDFTVACSA